MQEWLVEWSEWYSALSWVMLVLWVRFICEGCMLCMGGMLPCMHGTRVVQFICAYGGGGGEGYPFWCVMPCPCVWFAMSFTSGWTTGWPGRGTRETATGDLYSSVSLLGCRFLKIKCISYNSIIYTISYNIYIIGYDSPWARKKVAAP